MFIDAKEKGKWSYLSVGPTNAAETLFWTTASLHANLASVRERPG